MTSSQILKCLAYTTALATVTTLVSLPALAKKTVVTCYQQTAPSEIIAKSFALAAKEFEKRNPDIEVKIVNSAALDKILAAMAGGVAPDCAMIDERISSHAVRNILRPIDDFIKRAKVDSGDFWAPSWREVVWQGKTWAMPWGTDANFGLFINRNAFREVGLNPVSPKTIQELDVMTQKLMKKDENGGLKRVAMVPWSAYGYTNSMYTWGWCFGGEFYDSKTRKVTATDTRVVRALTWMHQYAAMHGGISKLGGVSSGLTSFTSGKNAMGIFHAQELPFLTKYVNSLDIEIGSMPVDTGVNEDPTWVGGWKIGMLPSTKHADATWRWIKFITADPVGTAILNEPIGWFPSYKKSVVYDRYQKDPLRGPFFKILQRASHQRPVMPAAQTYAEQLDQALNLVLLGKKEPAPAMAQCETAVQKELDRILVKYKVK